MTWLFLPILIAAAVAAYVGGRWAAARRGERLPAGQRPHSRPGQHGAYALIWTVVPALVVLFAAAIISPNIERQLTASGAPEAVQQLEPFRREAFFADARAVADGRPAVQIWPAPYAELLPAEANRAGRISQTLGLGGVALAALAALLGALFVFSQIRPGMRARNRVEGWIVGVLFVCSAVAILTTVGIIASLVYDSIRFFDSVPIAEFLFGTQWSPQTAIRADQVGSTGAFGALPLFAGTFLIMLIAMAVAAPVGLFSAIFLSEYASPVFRATVKPVLEILAGVPTVVYGFFAALTVGPAFREFFNGIGPCWSAVR
jgi:phosphate transport system permease protein